MGANLLQANAILKVTDFGVASRFYTEQLGFTRDWDFHLSDAPNPAYGGFSRDGVSLHVSSFSSDSAYGGAVLIYVEDVDALYSELAGRDVTIDLEPTDQTWGTRDMYVRDPDGNCIRFCQSSRFTVAG